MAARKPAVTQLDRSHPLADGLTGAWLHNERGGMSLHDYSGYGNHGTLTNMEESDWTSNAMGPTLDFGGTNEYVNCGANDYSGTGVSQLTVLFWATLANFTAAQPLGWRGKTYTARIAWCFEVTDATQLRMWGVSTDFEYAIASPTLAANVIYQLGFVYDGSQADANKVRFVQDGRMLSSSRTKGWTALNNASTDALYFGTFDSYRYHIGNTSMALIYKRPLASSEVLSLYRDPFAMFRPRRRVAKAAAAGAAVWNRTADRRGGVRVYPDCGGFR